ncbi:MAG: hypothetical protein A2070_05350 [Bdellovibrionales bacterium GWC1_52_8]|nr:MAG: hypothetical protein A2Z97_07185 [Bdellovibrionales bacterium GWB1_52_6]OFZ04467.1 MAG: hypothetical protein A2X97_06490 [Bdellovibrionales bacterium GWA1_52_35]OFZ35927.1 MAG: hypothetical protein A2070_05350 [Bdellovibrionales bacterium GWC1_52_8]
MQIRPKRKIAFVCSGGATKAGAFHLGVALALQEHGFSFYGGSMPKSGPVRTPKPMEISTYVGSSAGAIIATYLAAGYSLPNIFNSFLAEAPTNPDPQDLLPRKLPSLTYPQMLRIRPGLAREVFQQVARLRRVMGSMLEGNWEEVVHLNWMKTTGIFSTAGLEQFLREEVLISNHFQDYIADLFVVGTQLNHSRKVVFGKYNSKPPAHDLTSQYESEIGISHACAGSAALPPIYAPYPIKYKNGKTLYYVDGEIRDTLSTHVAGDAGADLVIASYTHQPYHFINEIGSLTEYGLPAIAVQSIYLLVEQKINNHIFNRKIQRSAIHAVHDYCKDQGFAEEHRKRICEILETELHHRLDVDTIYIHPNPKDTALFFGEAFTLAPKKLSEYVRSGFHAAIETLAKYEFADRQTGPAIGITDSGAG